MYQLPKCPYSYFLSALEFYFRVLLSLWVSLRILENYEILKKSQIWEKTKPSTQSPFQKLNFGYGHQKACKSKYQSFLNNNFENIFFKIGGFRKIDNCSIKIIMQDITNMFLVLKCVYLERWIQSVKIFFSMSLTH